MPGPKRTPHGGFNSREAYSKWTGKSAADAAASLGSANLAKNIAQLISMHESLMNKFLDQQKKLDKARDAAEKKKTVNEEKTSRKKKTENKSDETKRKEEDKRIQALEDQIHATAYFKKHKAVLKGTVDAKTAYLKGARLPPEQEAIAHAIRMKLGELSAYSRKSSVTTEDVKNIKALESGIARLEAVLPEKIYKKLENIEKKKESSHESDYERYKDDVKQFASNIGGMIKNLGQKIADGFMNFADKIGIGAFNVGNAIRLVKGAGRIGAGVIRATNWGVGASLSALGHGAKKLGRGAKSIGQGVASMFSGKEAETEQEDLLRKVVRLFGNFTTNVKASAKERKESMYELIRRIRHAPKQGMGMIGNLMRKMGGGIKNAATDLVGLLKSNFGSIMAAAAAGFAFGTWLYKTYDKQILDAIDIVVGEVKKAFEWVGEKWDWMKDKVKQLKSFLPSWLQDKKPEDRPAPAGQQNAQAAESRAAATAAMADPDLTKAARMGFGGTNIRNKARGGKGSPLTTAPFPVSTQGWTSGSDLPSGDMSGSPQRSGGPIGSTNISEMIKNYTRPGSNADIQGMNPAARENFLKMAADYYERTGKKLDVNSAKRSSENQARLYALAQSGKGNPAAPPGRSLHEFGYAVDINSSDAEYLEKTGMLANYGFQRINVPNEKHHIQVAGITAAAAKAGIYSADDPSKQGGPNTTLAMAKTGAGNTVPVTEPFTPVSTTAGGAAGAETVGGGRQGAGSASIPSGKGVNDIPLFSTVDGTLLAMNVGALAGG